jgi:hypothetical protein
LGKQSAKPLKGQRQEFGRFLSRLFRAFKNKDPKKKEQKSLHAVVLQELAKMRFSETQIATRELAIGPYFFACRSCKYLKVPATEEKEN